jgi:hypothetical protein
MQRSRSVVRDQVSPGSGLRTNLAPGTKQEAVAGRRSLDSECVDTQNRLPISDRGSGTTSGLAVTRQLPAFIGVLVRGA